MQAKFLKHKRIFKKGGLNTSPDLFWEFLLFMAFAILLLSFFFGSLLFIEVSKGPVVDVENNSNTSQTIDKERIDKVLEYFSERNKKSVEIINSPSPIVDPSL